MKYLIIVFSLLAITSFKFNPTEYRIVDGYIQYTPSNYPNGSSVYYLWDGTQSSTCSDRYVMLNFMQHQGFELVSTHACETSGSGGYHRYKETWIFKK